jgi:hypothetical protein
MIEVVTIVDALAKALDRDDFAAAGRLLSESCVYDSGRGRVTGRDAIIESYRSASDWAHAAFDEVVYESTIEPTETETSASVVYVDHVRKGELRHAHRCRQIVEVDARSGEIVAIAHRDIEGEAERLNAFFVACGVTRPSRDET